MPRPSSVQLWPRPPSPHPSGLPSILPSFRPSTTFVFKFLLIFFLCCFAWVFGRSNHTKALAQQKLSNWMQQKGFSQNVVTAVLRTDISSLNELAGIDPDLTSLVPQLTLEERSQLKAASLELRDDLLLQNWLIENDLVPLKDSLTADKVTSLDALLALDDFDFDPDGDLDDPSDPFDLDFPHLRLFLLDSSLAHALAKNGIRLCDEFKKAVQHLKKSLTFQKKQSYARALALHKATMWQAFQEQSSSTRWRYGAMVIVSAIVGLLFAFPRYILDHFFPSSVVVPRLFPSVVPGAAPNTSLFDTFTLNFPIPRLTKVKWEFEDPCRVGRTVSFQILFFKFGGNPFSVDRKVASESVSIEISVDDAQVVHTTSFAPSSTPSTPSAPPQSEENSGYSTPTRQRSSSLSLSESSSSFEAPKPQEVLPANAMRVTFTVHRAGNYSISIRITSSNVQGSPFVRVFRPGKLDRTKTTLSQQSPILTCTQGTSLGLLLQPRDRYNNKCSSADIEGSAFSLCASPVSTNLHSSHASTEIPVTSVFERHQNRLVFTSYPSDLGIFRVTVTYSRDVLKNCVFNLIVLSPQDALALEFNVCRKSHNVWYEARLLDASNVGKPRKVYVYISPRQVTIKEFYLKIFPKRLYTFRVCPSTRFSFNLSKQYSNPEIFSIDDGSSPIVDLISKDRDILIATFAHFLLKNIGGSETFHDKRDFFHTELLKHHSSRGRGRFPLSVQRLPDLFDSSYKALKHASTSDWCKLFEVHFEGEEGLDYGGLRREWFTLLTARIFKNGSGFFRKFSEDQLGLVHPCPASSRSPSIKTKYFEFAGRLVGKCLYESAQGSAYAQPVNGRFSRSFLAQLIGLRVSYKYFEQDDPDFYVSKVKYIIENDLDDPDLVAAVGLDDLTFSEEVYNNQGKLEQVIDLIPNGSRTRVTNANKYKYLDSLAQYRLVSSVAEEVEAFLKGLNELVPDSLLCIFDERELELLLCGTGKIDLDDFKAHTKVCSSSSLMFPRVIEWFWTVVSSFGQEELALLLQFTTGSSQLPNGGFKELKPHFQITHSPTYNTLPMAHTCFNQLCLPDYEDCATLHRLLLLAITEGSEGFAFQ